MKKVLAIHGSPRGGGNSSILLEHFVDGLGDKSVETKSVVARDLNLEYCHGCLRCNLIKKCSIRDDDWEWLSQDILEADILVFATPVYFHHLPAPMKTILDRFRSFVKVVITESGLQHIPWQSWNKEFVLLLTMGSSNDSDAQPIIDLFRYITSILGSGNRLQTITATRLAMIKQIVKSEEELKALYPKLNLPVDMASGDYIRNQRVLEKCTLLGRKVTT